MGTIVDSENVVGLSINDAPDKLRAEIGKYFSSVPSGPFSNFSSFRSGITNESFQALDSPDQQLIPTKRVRISFDGREDQFRDQTQWNEYVRDRVSVGTTFLDHQFSFVNPEITNSMVKNHHDPTYEDITKAFPTNYLLNYNLISYPHKDKLSSVQKIGDIRTGFDSENYLVDSKSGLEQLISEFPNRISNYSGSIQELDVKQRNIFDIQKPLEVELPFGLAPLVFFGPVVPLDSFPFYYSKTLPELRSMGSGGFNNILTKYKKRKNLFQAIKQDLFFTNRNFNIEGSNVSGKIHNLIELMTTARIITISEQDDELFLVDLQETDYDDMTSRFVDQINTVRFLSEMKNFIGGPDGAREIQDIFEARPCSTFFLGYKIEKYLDNAAGSPIQTYYTNDKNFYDTQLKYGRKYIYKTKLLLGVLGSAYQYSNLFISQNETQMLGDNGVAYSSTGAKYKAHVDVEAIPSFQVLEYQVDEDEVAFVDVPTLPPQVEFRNNSKKANVEFFFSPMFTTVESVVKDDGEELIRPFKPLTEEDRRINDLIGISKTKGVSPDYFTGIYEVYRMSSPPTKESEFPDHFLTRVDDQSGLVFPETMGLRPTVLDNMNGYFEDFIIPHKKYYYAFRALTHHGTPSNLTVPFEVELLRDSDEYKINISQYKYPSDKNYTYEKTAKRIVKIIPNIERLIFDELDESNKMSYKLDEGNMLTKGQTTKFKIRVTSKHTGKKIDINLNLKLVEDTNSFTQN